MDSDTLDQRTEEMIRRRVAGGANEGESRTMLAEFLGTAGRGFLPTALHYNGFATARGAETFTEAFFAEDPATEQVADLGGTDSPPLATAADITVEHSAEGTLVHGTSRGDEDAAQALKANGFRWSRNLDAWYLPRNLTHETRDQRVAALQGALGDRVEVEIPDGGRRLSAAEKETAQRERAADRAERMTARAERLQGKSDAIRAETGRFFANVPLGQPNIVDTSAGRVFTRKREKMHARDWKAYELGQEAAGARDAARSAEQTVTGVESIVTITNRIEKNQAIVRKVDREVTAHNTAAGIIDMLGADHPKIQAVGTDQLGLRSPERLAQIEQIKAVALDAIAHDQDKLEAAGGVSYGKHNVQPGDIIVARHGGYLPVLRSNAKSATVPTGYTWTDTLPWAKVTKVISAEKFTPDQARQLLEACSPDDKHRAAAFEKTLARATQAATFAEIEQTRRYQPSEGPRYALKATFTPVGALDAPDTVFLSRSADGTGSPEEHDTPQPLNGSELAHAQRQADRAGGYQLEEVDYLDANTETATESTGEVPGQRFTVGAGSHGWDGTTVTDTVTGETALFPGETGSAKAEAYVAAGGKTSAIDSGEQMVDEGELAMNSTELSDAEFAAATDRANSRYASQHPAPAPAAAAAVDYVPVSYHHVDFAQMSDGSAHRLTYDDTNPYALHAEIHAIAGGKQVGKVHWTPGYGNATVEVDPDRRRQGIGTQLMREAMATDPTAAQRWTPVTAAGQALGHRLGLDVPGHGDGAGQRPATTVTAPAQPRATPAASAWAREEASLLAGLAVDAAARQRLSGRQGLPQPAAAPPTPGVGR